MAEHLIHFAVPFAAFTALGVKPKLAFLLSLLALTPDLDVIFLIHRSISHSLVPLLVLAIPLLGLTRNRSILSWGITSRKIVISALLAVSSHILLDLASYTPILYPIIKHSYCINVDFDVHFGSAPNFSFNLEILGKPTIFKPIESLDTDIFTTQGLLTSTTLLAPPLFKALKSFDR